MNNPDKFSPEKSMYISSWDAQTLLDATKGYWIVPPPKNWFAYSFCIEEKFFSVGDVVFIKENTNSARNEKIRLYLNKGASGFIVENDISVDNFLKLPVLKVKSTSSALEAMAVYQRQRMKASVIGITGSVGKSTVREILYHLLKTQYKVHRTSANYNLLNGLQLSIVNTPVDTDYAIYEMAIGSPGSLSLSSNLAKPDAVVLTEISKAHLKRHISLENIVLEKMQILDSLNEAGCVSYLGESESSIMIKSELRKRKILSPITYGYSSCEVKLLSSELRLGNQTITFSCGKMTHSCILNLPGKHNAINALAAISILNKIGVDIDTCLYGLAQVMPIQGRMEHITIKAGNGTALLLNDAFNSNPVSMQAAIEYLDLIKRKSEISRTILVCSDMLDLGPESLQAHIELGKNISRSKIDLVFLTGNLSETTYRAIEKNKNVVFKKNLKDLIDYVTQTLKPDDVVLVKGSHSTNLYQLTDALLNTYHVNSPHVTNMKSYMGAFPEEKKLCFNPTGGAIFELKTNSHYSTIAIDRVIYPASLSTIFGLCYIYEQININPALLNDEVVISKYAASVPSKWVLDEGDRVTVKDLIYAVAICSSNEAMIALAEWHSGSEAKFALEATSYVRKLGFKQTIFRNATGLFNEGHVSSLSDIIGVIRRIKKSFPDLANIYASKNFNFLGQVYRNTNSLLGQNHINGFKTGRTPRSGFNLAITSNNMNEERIVVVVGCRSQKERDDFALELLSSDRQKFKCINISNYSKNPTNKRISISKVSDEISLSILGDTYFGEFYDEKRQESGKTNYLKKYGYQHSIKKLARFLASNDLNIVNLEASITSKKSSPLNGKKNWILGADPQKTIETLNAYKVDGVLLGNNHTYDYGIDEIPFGLEKLQEAGLVAVGAGLNDNEAQRPMKIDVKIGRATKRIYVFSGYAYYEYEAAHFSCYAGSSSPGVSNITSDKTLKMIADVKDQDHSAYIIVSPHWGKNYHWATSSQRDWAERYINAGADIIVGHGAHMLQEIETIRGRPVIYSLGNFIFNSNGEYRKRGVPSFSLLFQLKANQYDDQIKLTFDLIPIFCANHECGFQPRPATPEENALLSERIGFNFNTASLYT
jgi:UDP-N-acetylmuramoyl-tripeptide--D-alanyl-D-alanine ligase